LADAFGIGAGGLADVQSAVNAEDVAAFDGGGRSDVGEFAEGRESSCERLRLRLPGSRTQRKYDGEFVENDRGIFDEHGVGKVGLGGQRMDMDPELRQEMFVGSVLLLRPGEVNGLAFDEGEFAIGEGRAYGASNGGEHDGSLAGVR
jgi:hypothetical protein